uniref:Seipin n=1 Tax=Melanopsichium pennsylvanicum 4 TaxID=1398559 RepID=A0A077R270_9BASI|nr:putative protein [Melanopsichium pennsylvanicum 4]
MVFSTRARTSPPPTSDLANWIANLPHISQWPSLLIDRLLLAPISQLLEYTRDIILSPRTHRIVVRLGVLVTIFWIALAAAVISYVGFYRAWVPDIGLRKEVWLQYGHDRPPYAHLDFNTKPAYPFREPNPSSCPYNPSTDISAEFFATDQAYDVTLELSVPLNQANLDLGNFMVDFHLKNKINTSLWHVSKPTLLTYSSAPLRAVSGVSQLLSRNPPPVNTPANSQMLRITLLRRAVLRPSSFAPPLPSAPPDPRSDRKVTHGQISVGRHDALKYWMYGQNHHTLANIHALPGGNGKVAPISIGSHSSRGELQTYSASIRFDAHLTGLRFFMYHFPLLSFFTFTTLFLAFEMATALTLWAVAAIYTSGMTIDSNSGLATEEYFQSQKQQQQSRYGASRQGERGVKSETETETLTPTTTTTTTPSGGEESTWFEGRQPIRYDEQQQQQQEDGDETETETEAARLRRRRGGIKREPRIKVESQQEERYEDDSPMDEQEEQEEERIRLRSLESLREKDAMDLAEAIRQSRMRDLLEARRMSSSGGGAGRSGSGIGGGMIEIVDPTSPISPEELSEIQLSRRVLDRLDEETEEETEVGSSRSSSRLASRGITVQVGSGNNNNNNNGGGGEGETDAWEDVVGESGSGDSAVEATGFRQTTSTVDGKHDDDDQEESTIGGSTTSDGRTTLGSFGATTAAGSASTRTG